MLGFRASRFGFTEDERWCRAEHGLTKDKRIFDGELTKLLLGSVSSGQLDSWYESYEGIADKREKTYLWIVLSTAFLALVVLNLSQEINIAGMAFSPEAMPHVSLAILTHFSIINCWLQTKCSHTETLFLYMYETSSPSARTKLLLSYPRIFMPAQFTRSVRGYPNYVYPVSKLELSPFRFILQLICVVALTILVLGLYVYSLYIVWVSNFPSALVARSYVGLLVASGGLTIANPVFFRVRRPYRHFGMSAVLARLSEDRKIHYHRLICAVRERGDSRNLEI